MPANFDLPKPPPYLNRVFFILLHLFCATVIGATTPFGTEFMALILLNGLFMGYHAERLRSALRKRRILALLAGIRRIATTPVCETEGRTTIFMFLFPTPAAAALLLEHTEPKK